MDAIETTHVPLKVHIEAILTEREKALMLVAANLRERLDHERENYEKAHLLLVEKIDTLQNRQSWIMGIGTALVFVAGLIGKFLR